MELKWQPITDLPDNWQDLASPELASLAHVWAEQYERLKASETVIAFNEQLRREWSIETGILERLYTIDRGITQLLIEQGIDASLIPHDATDRPVDEVVRILQDHHDALEGIFDFVAGHRPLTTSYICQLHQALTQHQLHVEARDPFGKQMTMPLLRGDWKKWPNNPTRPDGSVHEYCPPLQVAGEMERLVEFYQSHENVPPEINAAWLHHRFTQIHPFQDGNGRVARALATIVFLQAGWLPLVINRDQRSDYISALEAADRSDLEPLVKLFSRNAKRALVRALTLSENVLQDKTVMPLPQLIEELANIYESRRRNANENNRKVEGLAQLFQIESLAALESVAKEIQQRFLVPDLSVLARADCSVEHNNHFYTAQILSVAEELDYEVNVGRQRYWTRLYLADGQKAHLVFSFHFLGGASQGIMVCIGFIYFPATHLEDETDANVEALYGETRQICKEPFTFTYADRLGGDLRIDFHKWHTAAIQAGLAEWAKRL